MAISFKHQQVILGRSKGLPRFALFTDPGTGKSYISIKTIESQYSEGLIKAAIIICPKSVMYTWVDQLNQHATVPFKVIMWNGFHNPEDVKAYGVSVNFKGLVYFIANTDCFVSNHFEEVSRHYINHFKKAFLVIDESTAFKDRGSKRTVECVKLADLCASVRLLSGTPITNSPLDMYSQARILGKNMLGFTSYFAFKTRYCVMSRKFFGARSFNSIDGYRDLDDLSQKVSRFAAIVKLDDCVDMPERVFSKIIIEMPEKQRKIYDDFRFAAVAEIEGNEVTAVNALSMMTKLLQIISGQIKLDDGTYASIPNNRLETLEEIIREREGKVLIWSSYVQTSKNIVSFLNNMGKNSIKTLHLSSDYNAAERQEILNKFRTDPEIKCLVLNPQSAAHGLTLVEAKTSIYFNNTYSLEQRLQSLARNYRIGQTSRTEVIDIVAKDTIEEKILVALSNMENIADKVTGREAVLKWFL